VSRTRSVAFPNILSLQPKPAARVDKLATEAAPAQVEGGVAQGRMREES